MKVTANTCAIWIQKFVARHTEQLYSRSKTGVSNLITVSISTLSIKNDSNTAFFLRVPNLYAEPQGDTFLLFFFCFFLRLFASSVPSFGSPSIIYTNASYYILYIEYVHVTGYLQVECEAGDAEDLDCRFTSISAIMTPRNTRPKSSPTSGTSGLEIARSRDLRPCRSATEKFKLWNACSKSQRKQLQSIISLAQLLSSVQQRKTLMIVLMIFHCPCYDCPYDKFVNCPGNLLSFKMI